MKILVFGSYIMLLDLKILDFGSDLHDKQRPLFRFSDTNGFMFTWHSTSFHSYA